MNASLAIDLSEASAETPRRRNTVSFANSSCSSPRKELNIKYNGELNGYHFHKFDQDYICREELPRGSQTFQQVIDEITEENEVANVSEKPQPVPVKPRRKSMATTPRPPFGFGPNRRVSFAAKHIIHSHSVQAFSRPRVLSDGAAVGLLYKTQK